MAEPKQRARLSLDPAACDGIGICAHLAAELVRVDTWGFPLISGQLLGDDALRRARAAVTACPRQALYLTEIGTEPPDVSATQSGGADQREKRRKER